jgi:hypothetical protein
MHVLGADANTGSTSGRCPRCAKVGVATLERVIVGVKMTQQWHCKACGASWVKNPENAGEDMKP